MRLTEKTERYSGDDKRFKGKKKNYNVEINFSAKNLFNNTEGWWYLIRSDNIGYSYNSLWDDLKYKTKDECATACEKKIDEICDHD